ncbi:hsp90 co-chaperone Aha1p [[Candida] railenensis]|uniref:Hsp90 co-chaperone Aha1p n=1 Tax=[Candida] railenensis TaxID=45579 RepID=A0A9P0QMN8_9ASCO|nr:hsp90 co-chaperone Aha1p [[Candida] railenensis]
MVVNNPNNWHWVDKNCIDWTRNYFNEKLVKLSAEDESKTVEVASVSSIEGDVEVCQRKGKVISLFDLKVTLDITGFAIDASKEEGSFKGSIVVPELAYDSEADDLQFDISIYNEDSTNQGMRVITKNKLVPKLREILAGFGSDLIKTHSSDIQLSSDKVNSQFTKSNQESNSAKAAAGAAAPTASVAAPTASKTVASTPSSTKPASSVPRYNTATLHLEPTFNTSAEQLYITLLDQARIAAWSRSAPQIDAFPPKEGSTFKLFGGSVSGKILKLVPNEQITQLWRLEDWRDGHFATLDIQLVQGPSETKMVVKWSGIPVGEEDRVRGNFENYYIRSIKITFGFGAVL